MNADPENNAAPPAVTSASAADAAPLQGTLDQDPEKLERIVSIALANTVNGVVIADATHPHLPIVHVNAGFTKITGYTAEEVYGRNCNFLQGPERDQPEVAQLRAAIAAGEPTTVTVRNYRKDGRLFWNQVELSPVRDESGRITHFFALQTDVSLKREVEQANTARALELERMLRGGPLGMVLVGEDGRVSLVSPSTWRLLGLAAQPVKGMTGPEWTARVSQLLELPDGSLPWPQMSQKHVRWDIPFPSKSRALDVSCFEMGSLTREHIVVLRDVTTEEEHQNTRAQFLAMAAHELRTPMGSITGFTELLLMRNYSAEQAKPLLETILRQSLRLGALLDDLLDLSQMEALGAQAFPVTQVRVMEVARKALQFALPPGRERGVHLHAPSEEVVAQGHPQKLEQVLINLISNAIKYSPNGGDVDVTVQVAASEGMVHIAITDRGMGLSEAHQARLFTRFFRANPGGPIPGTGLGLVIVKELVERMGGRIAVRSQLGQGSTFTVSLPHIGVSS